MPSGTLLYAQSGGVTAVINATAAAVLEAARKRRVRVLAARNGILGALREELVDTSRMPLAAIRALAHTPGGAFGSCRVKLKSLEEDRARYERLIAVLRAHDVRWFLYNGGNDSADTALKLSKLAAEFGYPLTCVGVPKTVDNDLAVTDCCPGFGSAAKYTAVSVREAALDVAAMAETSTKVFVYEAMGRHAGWLAAAGGLAGAARLFFLTPLVAGGVLLAFGVFAGALDLRHQARAGARAGALARAFGLGVAGRFLDRQRLARAVLFIRGHTNPGECAKVGVSEGFDDDQRHHHQEQQDGNFVEPAIELVRTGVLALFEFAQHEATGVMVADDEQHEKELGVHPAIAGAHADTVTHVKPHPENDGHDRQNGGEAVQPARHAEQRRLHGGIRLLGQVHKDARQIEQAGKPGGDEDDVKGLDPEHGHGAIQMRKAALYARRWPIPVAAGV